MKHAVSDCHSHTFRSHDSQCAPEELCKSAIEKNLCGIAVTNHCDMHLCKKKDVFSALVESNKDVHLLRPVFARQFRLFSGVEIGEGIWFPEETKKIYTLADWDIILGSVHTVRQKDTCVPYSAINFSDWTEHQVRDFLSQYFRDVLQTADMDIDALCHLTCPLRYISGKFGHMVDLSEHSRAIQEILLRIIEKDIALEVNTSCVGSAFDQLLPDKDILQKYYALGGRNIILGSDAHVPSDVGKAFDTAIQVLKEIGFSQCSFYSQRKKQVYAI